MLSNTNKLKQLEKLYLNAKKAYYNSSKPLLSDIEFDKLEDKIRELNPNSSVLNLVGYKVENGIKLPYNMSSLNKKKEDNEINKWLSTYNQENIILTDKLDGISIIAIYDNYNIQLLTRGDGITGTDITKIVDYIDIPTNMADIKLVLRGEIVIKKSIYNSKYIKNNTSSRNFVSGLILAKTLKTNILKDLDIVWYSVYYPENLTYSQQLEVLHIYHFNSVYHDIVYQKDISHINKNILQDYYKNRILNSEYDIDGIVLQYNNNEINNIENNNPKNACAFKMDNDTAIVKVLNIKWNISKNNYIIPIIEIEPTQLSGATIKNITGINAKYIQSNNIGTDSIIEIVRSGEVIPKVLKVIKPTFNITIDFPKNYVWHVNNIHIMPHNNNTEDRNIKLLEDSFKKLEVEGLNTSTINKLYHKGYNTINKILTIQVDDILTLDNFKELSSIKLYNNINKAYNNAELYTIMNFSNLLGENIGLKNIKLLLKHYPNILELNITTYQLIEKLNNIPGFGSVKSDLIGNNLNNFKIFYNNLPPQHKNSSSSISNYIINTKYNNKKIIFSGIRDNDLESIIEASGGIITSSVTKDTDYLIVKDINIKSSKINKAQQLNIPIINFNTFINNFI